MLLISALPIYHISPSLSSWQKWPRVTLCFIFAQEIKWKPQWFFFKKGKIKIQVNVKDALRTLVALNNTLFLLIHPECMKHV